MTGESFFGGVKIYRDTGSFKMKPNLHLSIGFLNIEGINDSILGFKLAQLKDYLNCDIGILAESWGNCTDYELEHYNCFKTEARKDPSIKKGKSSGGIIVY